MVFMPYRDRGSGLRQIVLSWSQAGALGIRLRPGWDTEGKNVIGEPGHHHSLEENRFTRWPRALGRAADAGVHHPDIHANRQVTRT